MNNVSKCHICDCDANLYDECYFNENVKVCFLCRIVINNKKDDVYRCILVYSKLTQVQVIKKTREFYQKNDRIPFPQEIDQDAKLFPLQVYLFSKLKNKELFPNIVIFFTSHVEDFMEDEVLSAFKPTKRKTTILKYYQIEEVKLTNEQLEFFESNRKQIRQSL
jgi:hypothetical protein